MKTHIGALGPAWFLSVNKTIVCVDDIERRGANLSAREVLGLVSFLKEQRNCKVILIWNDDAEDKERAEFEKYHEKVVDRSLNFEPTPNRSHPNCPCRDFSPFAHACGRLCDSWHLEHPPYQAN